MDKKKSFECHTKKKRWKNYEEHEHIKKQSRQCATITKESVERASERYKIGIDVACANIYIHEPFKMWLIWKLRFAALVYEAFYGAADLVFWLWWVILKEFSWIFVLKF